MGDDADLQAQFKREVDDFEQKLEKKASEHIQTVVKEERTEDEKMVAAERARMQSMAADHAEAQQQAMKAEAAVHEAQLVAHCDTFRRQVGAAIHEEFTKGEILTPSQAQHLFGENAARLTAQNAICITRVFDEGRE